MGYTANIAKLLGLLEHFPSVDAYLVRLSRRPAFQRAIR